MREKQRQTDGDSNRQKQSERHCERHRENLMELKERDRQRQNGI